MVLRSSPLKGLQDLGLPGWYVLLNTSGFLLNFVVSDSAPATMSVRSYPMDVEPMDPGWSRWVPAPIPEADVKEQNMCVDT